MAIVPAVVAPIVILVGITMVSANLLVDLAYGEFADEDLTPAALALPNAVIVRSLSKAWGLAGLRIALAWTSSRRRPGCPSG